MITFEQARQIAGEKAVEKYGADYFKENIRRLTVQAQIKDDSYIIFMGLFSRDIKTNKKLSIGGDEYPQKICEISVSKASGDATFI